MSSKPNFTASVTSGGMLNIPKKFQEMHEIEENDLVEVEVKRCKKPNGEVIIGGNHE